MRAVRSVALLLAVAVSVSLAMPRAPVARGQANATWARSLFFRGHDPTTGAQLTGDDPAVFARTLRDAGITYAYVFAGPFQADGSLPSWATSATAAQSIARMRAVHPDLVVLPWVGGIQGKTVRLHDARWRAAALDAVAHLLATLPVPGVHLDFELVLPGEPYLRDKVAAPGEATAFPGGLLAFHTDARARFPDRFLSSVLVSTAAQTRPWKHKATLAEATALARTVDQLAFLFYDTGISDPAVYAQAVDEQLAHFDAIRAALGDRTPQLLVAVGTFVNEPPLRKYRDRDVERLPDTLALLRGAARAGGRPRIDGLAIYCEWLTEPDEWRQLREGWTALPSND